MFPRVVYERGRISPYLDKTAFRHNNRDNPYLFRDTLITLVGAEAMPYQELIRTKVSESTIYKQRRAQKALAEWQSVCHLSRVHIQR